MIVSLCFRLHHSLLCKPASRAYRMRCIEFVRYGQIQNCIVSTLILNFNFAKFCETHRCYEFNQYAPYWEAPDVGCKPAWTSQRKSYDPLRKALLKKLSPLSILTDRNGLKGPFNRMSTDAAASSAIESTPRALVGRFYWQMRVDLLVAPFKHRCLSTYSLFLSQH